MKFESLLNRKDIERFLEEDIGSGDLTSQLLLPKNKVMNAYFLAKEDFVLAGMKEALDIIAYLDPDLEAKFEKDGKFIKSGDKFCSVKGKVDSLLIGERTALNLLQRMSGIATNSKKYSEQISGKTRVVDTRKTTPGLRILEKYAVRVGGCFNHRIGLYDGILIKDNHIRAAVGVANAVKLARAGAHHLVMVEIEVCTLEELQEAIKAGADGVLLDNMDNEMIKEAVEIIRGRLFVEVSGGITLERIASLCEIGVDYISSGALTYAAKAVDISFEIEY